MSRSPSSSWSSSRYLPAIRGEEEEEEEMVAEEELDDEVAEAWR